MSFDFDEIVPRRGTDSVKWDVGEDELPLWIADMDFRTAPCVLDAIRRRLDNGALGYSLVPDEWEDAYIKWWRDRHDMTINRGELIFTTGAVPALSTAVRRLTVPAERIVLLTPVYNIFFNSIVNNGRTPLECPLVTRDGGYEIDMDDLAEKLARPQTRMLILCDPHNPTGNIWSAEDLDRIGRLCADNGVTVVSDELHCDLTDPGKSYVPFASVSQTNASVSVTLLSPSKAFNTAGLQSAAVYCPDPTLRAKMVRALNTDEVAEPNVFAVRAAVAAFNEGGPWLDELREYLSENKKYARSFISERIPGITVARSDATYLLWADVSGYTSDSESFVRDLRAETGLILSAGKAFGGDGQVHVRINTACPRETLRDALERLKKYVALIS